MANAINTQENAEKKVIGTPFKEGNPGKPRGAKNHLTKTVKETVLAVFNELQLHETASLKAWAEKKPGDFYQIAAKLIPTEITAEVSHTVETVTGMIVKKKDAS